METLCVGVGGRATVVTGYGSSTHDLSAWGTCFDSGAPKFCCVFDDTSDTVTSVELSGTDYDDEALSFVDDFEGTNERNLKPWDDDPIVGYIRGNAGGDLIWGSNYAPVDYNEYLFGQNGSDVINGHAGGDFISGGNHDDALTGAEGNDTIWGGDGDDILSGGDGNDKLCDASGYDFCASSGGNYFDGGPGDDKIWYEESENPNVPCPGITMDSSSTAGSGTDQCGDYSNWTTSELPQLCNSYITTRPTLCEGAN
ncbi:MAG: calcium-binding protein [Myxococcota bacterium]